MEENYAYYKQLLERLLEKKNDPECAKLLKFFQPINESDIWRSIQRQLCILKSLRPSELERPDQLKPERLKEIYSGCELDEELLKMECLSVVERMNNVKKKPDR